MDIEERIQHFILLSEELENHENGNGIDRIKRELADIFPNPEYSKENPFSVERVKLAGIRFAYLDFTFGSSDGFKGGFVKISFYPPVHIEWERCFGLNDYPEDGYKYRRCGYIVSQESDYGILSVCSAERNFDMWEEQQREGNFFEVARMDQKTREFIQRLQKQAEPPEPKLRYCFVGGYVNNGYFLRKDNGVYTWNAPIRIFTYPPVALIGVEYQNLGKGSLISLFNHLGFVSDSN